MPATSAAVDPLILVQQGWSQLFLQRPLAAWACWQRVLRADPENTAAREAIDLLEVTEELPHPARANPKFRSPADDNARDRWNATFRGRDLSDLDLATQVFADLTRSTPDDAAAAFNLALCLAWKGENRPAIAALDLSLASDPDDSAAVASWMLAEVLRQGAGAEDLADDLSCALEITIDDADVWLDALESVAILMRMPDPIAPDTQQLAFPEAQAFEWLDRPMPDGDDSLAVGDLPRVLASVILLPDRLHLSSPDPRDLQQIEAKLAELPLAEGIEIDRRSTPLPLILLDAAVWRFRLPEDIDQETRSRLTREAVERYFEDQWVLKPRIGLADDNETAISPRELAWQIGEDRAARLRLSAVIQMREAIAARPRSEPLYAGYPFDRLRRRLGLPPLDPQTVDGDDLSCMGDGEFQNLALESLDDSRLMEAYRSAIVVAHPATQDRLLKALSHRGLLSSETPI